ncbi:hypothetical protein [Sediminispirochaeta bajacaliforniensis]|uniref:hypothetical protein n=1 Tax=Sediminispirochaeta bajacaliforniensis TaxID=148 RepID=UPI00037DEC5F|nr:hypothetical protein [Sediminispirochaeta bajacaliforniensis]
MIALHGNELIGVYLLLKHHEPEGDEPLADLMQRIETYLYQRLSIEEMEQIEYLYEKNIDVLSSKG